MRRSGSRPRLRASSMVSATPNAWVEPGRVHRLELTNSPLPIGFAPGSTHAFGVAETIELARNLGRLPERLIAYLIEGERFATGTPLSPAAAGAVDEAAQRIVMELSTILAAKGDRTCMRRH